MNLLKFSLVEFSVRHPKLVVSLTILFTLAFMTQFPKMRTDTNPKNMLPATSDVRVWNDEVDKTFALYEDMIVLGIARENGVLNPETLGRIGRITDQLLRIKGVAARDVTSFPTITNVTSESGTLKVAPLMAEVPKTDSDLRNLRKMLFENPLFIDRIISKDGKTTAIYVPLEKGANGKEVADRIREIVKKEKGDEKYYIAGDPVARDTFGAEMFKLMAIFAPIAGMVMLVVRYLMFRDVFLSITLMMDAMISMIWSMGLLIALGFPIHIMSSMAPVFLMAIATDSIHIFNEFYFRYRENKDKRAAIIETMHAVGRPVRYTALATAAGFAVLLFMSIVPVRVFGGLVAFGTVALRILSFSFIPAMFTFVNEKNIEKAAQGEDVSLSKSSQFLKGLAGVGAYRPGTTVLVGLILGVVAIVGVTRIVEQQHGGVVQERKRHTGGGHGDQQGARGHVHRLYRGGLERGRLHQESRNIAVHREPPAAPGNAARRGKDLLRRRLCEEDQSRPPRRRPRVRCHPRDKGGRWPVPLSLQHVGEALRPEQRG
ncbi:MAG: MMPL family transporter [Candidatus Rokubacteria bacterium]|nr:MMPL family transporter [Candidatus Rokubacteria bacterium]